MDLNPRQRRQLEEVCAALNIILTVFAVGLGALYVTSLISFKVIEAIPITRVEYGCIDPIQTPRP